MAGSDIHKGMNNLEHPHRNTGAPSKVRWVHTIWDLSPKTGGVTREDEAGLNTWWLLWTPGVHTFQWGGRYSQVHHRAQEFEEFIRWTHYVPCFSNFPVPWVSWRFYYKEHLDSVGLGQSLRASLMISLLEARILDLWTILSVEDCSTGSSTVVSGGQCK